MESGTGGSVAKVLLQYQVSLPGRRDYQLSRRSSCQYATAANCSTAGIMETTTSVAGLGPRASHFTRTLSFNSPRGVPVVSLSTVDAAADDHRVSTTRAAPPMRAFFSGPLMPSRGVEHAPESNASQCVAAQSHKLSKGTAGGGPQRLRKWGESEVGSSCRAESASSFRSSDECEHEEQIERVVETCWEESAPGLRRAGNEDQGTSTISFNQSASAQTSCDQLSEHHQSVLLQRISAAPGVSTKCAGRDQFRTSKQNSSSLSSKRVHSREQIAASAAAAVIAADVPAPKLISTNREDKLPDQIANSSSSRHHGSDSNRRPTASIAWDTFNISRESSPRHDLAAIPFRWEEAPGKPKTTLEQQFPATATDQSSRMLARREGYEHNHLDKTIITDILETSTSEDHLTSSGRLRQLQDDNRLDSCSFRSSHRFYPRTASSCEAAAAAAADRNFGSTNSSIDTGHLISEVEAETHIDLIAPAAAKFLVESCPLIPSDETGVAGSRDTFEVEQSNFASVIPFKWEEAPGKPKHQDTATASLRHMQSLQLPPRLLAGPQRSDSMTPSQWELELQLRQQRRTNKYVSMSGPLIGYYQRSSAAAELMNQSCSTAMALQQHNKHQQAAIAHQQLQNHHNHTSNNKVLRHSYTSGYKSGPLEGSYKDKKGYIRNNNNTAHGSRKPQQLLQGRSLRCKTSTSASTGYRSGPLENTAGVKMQSRSSSPSLTTDSVPISEMRIAVSPSSKMVAILPSRIHTNLAKHLMLKKGTAAPPPPPLPEFVLESALEDPNWPVQTKNLKQSFSKSTLHENARISEGSNILGRSEITGIEGSWADLQQQARPLHDTCSPRSILHGPNDNCQTPTSDPSSASDRDLNTQTQTASNAAAAAAAFNMLSQSLSCASYESFEHSFSDHDAATTSPCCSFPATGDHASCSSPRMSPYRGGPSSMADYDAGKESVRATSEGVQAITNLCCQTGCHWQRSKHNNQKKTTHDHMSLAQPLAQQKNGAKKIKSSVYLEHDSTSPVQSPEEALARLPYTMPSVVAAEHLDPCGRDYCHSPKNTTTVTASSVGVKLSPVKFIMGAACSKTWRNNNNNREATKCAPKLYPEDGYRSPAYTATLELLSPSADLISKKKKTKKKKQQQQQELAKQPHKKATIPSQKICRKKGFFALSFC